MLLVCCWHYRNCPERWPVSQFSKLPRSTLHPIEPFKKQYSQHREVWFRRFIKALECGARPASARSKQPWCDALGSGRAEILCSLKCWLQLRHGNSLPCVGNVWLVEAGRRSSVLIPHDGRTHIFCIAEGFIHSRVLPASHQMSSYHLYFCLIQA